MIIIEQNIPMPTSKFSNIGTMKIGESFIIKNSSERNAVRAWIKKNTPEIKICSRKVDAGFRIWRVK